MNFPDKDGAMALNQDGAPRSRVPPKEKIANSILVFDGRFEIPLASAITHENKADEFFQHNELELALSEARVAVALAPKSVGAQASLGSALLRLKRDDEARRAFQTLSRSRKLSIRNIKSAGWNAFKEF